MSPFHHFHGKTLLLLPRPLCFSLSWPCFWTAAAVLSWLSGTAAKNHQPEWRRLRGWRDRDFVENYWKCPPLHLGSSLAVCALCLCQMTLVWTGFSLSACLLCSWWTQAARRPSECCSRSEWFIRLTCRSGSPAGSAPPHSSQRISRYKHLGKDSILHQSSPTSSFRLKGLFIFI